MRIVVFSREFPEYCFRYANAMARHADVLLVLDRSRVEMLFDLTNRPKHERLTVMLDDFRSLRSAAMSVTRMLRAILAFRPDYVHLQEIPDRVAPLLAGLLTHYCKVIWTVHDPFPHSGADSQLPRDQFVLRDWGRRQADLFVLHGPICRDDFVRANPHFAERSIVSQHGVLMTPNVAVEPEPRSLLFFGRMQHYKGLDTLVEAAELLRGRGVAFRLTVAGSGPELDRFADRLAAMEEVRVISGFITQQTAQALFQEHAMIVLPYKDASQSGVAAAAYGNLRPVIASRVGGLPDVVEDGVNGLLVPPSDPAALADAMQYALDTPGVIERLSLGARETAFGKLDWDHIAQDLAHRLHARVMAPVHSTGKTPELISR